jgi:hypothetical protein
MDVYLPADFYRLRDELNDWRDAPGAGLEKSPATERVSDAFDAESRDACADPLWRVI